MKYKIGQQIKLFINHTKNGARPSSVLTDKYILAKIIKLGRTDCDYTIGLKSKLDTWDWILYSKLNDFPYQINICTLTTRIGFLYE